MLNIKTKESFLFFVAVLLLLLSCGALFKYGFITPVSAAPNYEINYQGKLTDDLGATVADGLYDMRFRLYDAPTGGSVVWTEFASTTVTNGLFSVMLGSSTPLTSVDFNQTLYLGVRIEADLEMTPRKILGAVPAAFEAANAETFAGIATTSFLRSDQADTALGLLTFSNGLISQASSTIFGLTTNTATTTNLIVNGQRFTNLLGSGLTNVGNALTANISESNLNIAAAPVNGYVLQASSTAAGGLAWVATSSLNISSGTNLSFGTDTQIPYMNAGDDDFDYSASLTFDGSLLTAPIFNASGASSTVLTLVGQPLLRSSEYGIALGMLANGFEGTHNVAIGYTALAVGGTALQDNVAIGALSQEYNLSGDENVSIGSFSLGFNATGSENVAIGYGAGQNIYTSRNVAVGHYALGNAWNWSSQNIAIGYYAGYGVESGANNILLGYEAGRNLESGSNNILIGHDIELQNNTWSNRLNIGNLIFGTGIDGTGTTLSSGNIGIGTSTPDYKLDIYGDARIDGDLVDSTGSAGTAGWVLQTTATGIEWVATSSLNISSGSAITFGTDNQIPYINAGGDDYDYSANLTFNGSLLTVGGDILPATTLTYDLGSASNRFANLWTETINVGTSTWSIFNGSNGRFAISNAAEQAGTEALTILSNGDIGIGVASPLYDLQLNNSAGATFSMGEDNQNSVIRFAGGRGYVGYGGGSLAGVVIQSGPDRGINFNVNNGSFSPTNGTAMRIDKDGNVGIGTTNPFSEFHVQGDSTFSGQASYPSWESNLGSNSFQGQLASVGYVNSRDISNVSNGLLTHIDTDDQGDDFAVNVWGDGKFIYVANAGAGLFTYSVSATGSLTLIDSDDQGGYANAVWGDGEFIYLANYGGGLLTYSVSDTGVLTFIDADYQGGSALNVWGDGEFIYLANFDGGLLTYSVSDTGVLTHIDTDDQGFAYSAWGDGEFIYVANGGGGLLTYSVSDSGVLTLIDTDDQGGDAFGVWGDGEFIYVANYTGGILTYSVSDSGVLTFIDADDQGDLAYNVWGDGEYVYLANYTGGIHTYSVSDAGVLTHIGFDDQGDNALGVWGDGKFIYVANATGGLLSYSVDNAYEYDKANQYHNFLTGNVGIGTSTPTQLLSLAGSAPQAYFYDSINNRGAYFGVGDGFNAVVDSYVGSTIIKANGAAYLTVGGGTSYFETGTMVGIGTSTPDYTLDVYGDARIDGDLVDSTGSAGTAGWVLQSTATGIEWVATSSLNISSGSTITFGTDNQIPYTNSGGTDYDYSASLTFDGTLLSAPIFNASGATTTLLSFNGAPIFAASSTRSNLFVGGTTPDLLTTGNNNTAFGYGALEAAFGTSSFNVAVGNNALEYNTYGQRNIGVGTYALSSMFSGNDNTAVGDSVMNWSEGSRNTAIGAGALAAGGGGDNNVALGYAAANGLGATGHNNILIGYRAGDALDSGDNNILIGYDIDLQNNTWSNRLNMGNLLFGTGIDGTGTSLSSGNIGIGTSTPNSRLHVAGTGNTTLTIQSNDANDPTLVFSSHVEDLSGDWSVYSDGSDADKLKFKSRDGTNYDVLTLTQADQGASVGIGTSSPASLLDVWGDFRVGTSGVPTLAVHTNNNLVTIGSSVNPDTIDGSGTMLYVDGAIKIQDGSVLRWDSTGAAGTSIWGSNTSDYLHFLVNGFERLSIIDGGNVGIGNNNPANKLTIGSNIGALSGYNFSVSGPDGTVFLQSTSSTGYSGVNMYNDSDVLAASFQYANASAGALPNSMFLGTRIAGAPLIFVTGAGVNERMRIGATGQVMIGTTTPRSANDLLTLYDDSQYGAKLVVSSGYVGATGPNITLFHSRDGAPLSNWDSAGAFVFGGTNSAGAEQAFTTFTTLAKNTTDSDEEGAFYLDVTGNGIDNYNQLYLDEDEFVINNNQSDINVSIFDDAGDVSFFADAGTGNVAIGTTSPSANLTVYGNIQLEGANRYLNFGPGVGTTSYGIRDNAGTLQFKQSGGVWSDFGSGGGSQWTDSGSDIYFDTGNVAIGTTDPEGWDLSVNGYMRLEDGYYYNAATGQIQHLLSSSGNYGTIQNDAANTWSLGYSGDQGLTIENSVLTWNTAGNVGIGTTTPQATLDVYGSAGLGDIFTLSSSTLERVLTVAATGYMGLGTDDPQRRLDVAEPNAVAQFRITKTLTDFAEFLVDGVGDLYLSATGGDIFAADENLHICEGDACPTDTATSTKGNLFVENAITIGDGFSLRQVAEDELGLYNTDGSLMVIFDNGE